jgi:uncharacterized protein with beta-barrel porin domain
MGAMGGKGGQAAANVTVKSYGSITTDTLMSHGIVAQSIAGGGGMSTGRPANVILGGRHNGDGGSVVVNSYDAITTSGTTSIGIVAQSIGGGGGLAATTGTATLGGSENGSDAGAVTVTSNAPIATSGTNAVGILAQSVGGGGGAVLSFGNRVPTTLLWGGGNASDVTVNVNAPITTTGGGADGVVAQSVAGGGGLVMDGTTVNLRTSRGNGRSGVVYVNVAPHISIRTSGTNAAAIKTMSSTDPVIKVGEGASIVGGDGGAAIQSDSPLTRIDNAGTLATINGTGMAIRALSGDTTVNNTGTLLGSISLAQGGANILQNAAGGTILAGASLDLGGGSLHNAGTLGHAGTQTGRTVINGSLAQADRASLIVRMDQATGTADSFDVSGSATLSGTLRPALLNAEMTRPGTLLKTVLSAAGNLDISGLELAGQSAVVKYGISSADGKVGLATKVDFSPGGLTRDGAAIGRIIGQAQATGRTSFRRLMPRLLALQSTADLDQAYFNVSGASLSELSNVGAEASTEFMTHLLDLPGSSVRSRGSVPLAAQQSQGDEQGWRVWGRDFGGSSRTPARQSAGPGELSVADHGMAIGFDYRNEPGTMFGVGLAKAATRFTTGSGTMGNSDDHQFGVYGTTQVGSFYLAGAASTGRFDYATTRTLSLIGASHKAWFRATSWGARMETGVRLDTASLGITPYVAMQFANFVTPAFDEAPDQHAPVAALRFLRRSTDNYRMEEGVAFERMFDLRGPRSLAISLRAAWVHQWSSNPDLGAAFEAAEFSSFRVGGEPPVKDLALLSAGADMRLTGNLSIGARFDGQFGSRARHYSGLATLGYRW